MNELLGKILAIEEVVAAKVDLQKLLFNAYKNRIGKLKRSTFPGEHGYKFWLLTDGKLVPVDYSHDKTAKDVNIDFFELLKQGAVRGYVDPDSGMLNIDTRRKLTRQQIIILVGMFVPYKIKLVYLDAFGISTGNYIVKSSKELDYLLTYGTLDESLVEARGYWRDWTEVRCQNPECSWREYRKTIKKNRPEIYGMS